MLDERSADGVVLVVDDDEGIREALDMTLTYEGYDVRLASDGAIALGLLAQGGIDVVIVDVMMPHVDGLSMCRALRQRRDLTPILVLTARSEVTDRVAGLDAGADDYLAKPFAIDELLARVRALRRRFRPDDTDQPLVVGDLKLDPQSRLATRAGRAIELTKTEYGLLDLMMRNPKIVLQRSVIYDRIWGVDLNATSRSLDVYVSYLRQKTEEGGERRLIHTVRGTGFVIDPDR
jgi:two-component system response regulator MprA|tara:strand:- start:8842 stop:9543 length:702 start_codon:yes stop_codon:yes gene_type:complete